MRGAVFAYHAQNCGGYDYSGNDHLAFAQDLQAVQSHGLPIVSLSDIAVKLSTGRSDELPRRFVAFSCDDGTLLDWRDYDHPLVGMQRSFANILRDHVAAHDITADKLLTAFVIASPEARKAIDAGCYEGNPLSDDDWWPDAAREGLLAIENHSWDHLHAVLPPDMLQSGTAGDFHSIDSYSKADYQVRAATEYIDARLSGTGCHTSLFAYPYGHESTYLSGTYFPRYREEHGMVGAFTTAPGYIDRDSPVYGLPRFMCGDAWRAPAEFEGILRRLLQP